MRERGFNQAELLAKQFAKNTNQKIILNTIARIKPTESQTGLSKTKRFTNLRGAFKITSGIALCDMNILLIDDVVTTGASLESCGLAILAVSGTQLSIATIAYTL